MNISYIRIRLFISELYVLPSQLLHIQYEQSHTISFPSHSNFNDLAAVPACTDLDVSLLPNGQRYKHCNMDEETQFLEGLQRW